MSVHLLLLAGGKGTRFWPLSRPERPKQLLPLLSDKTLLRETYERVRSLGTPERIWVLGANSLKKQIRAELPELPAAQFISEPVGRNTAASVALGAALALKQDPRAVLAVFPCDHHIVDAAAFRRAARLALKAARQEPVLVTLGIRPDRPETGYGYIRLAEAIKMGQAQVAKAFVEKPALPRAKRYLSGGRHLWNSGMFFFGAEVLREAFLANAPDIWEPAEDLADSYPGRRFAGRLAKEYSSIPARSFDVAVMEKAGNLRVVPAEFGWSDVGNWEALGGLLEETDGNRIRGRVRALDSRGNIVIDTEGLTALLGVENLIVVRSGERLLVCHRDRAQSVRKLMELMDTE